jgi:uncharacterized protein YrzB (UPF0473 family)
MQRLQSGLPREALYSTCKMTDVTVCLDSGLRATDACKNDIRGDRTETVKCYPEDRPKDSCTTHVELEICSGGGVATEYCKNFASVDSKVTLTTKSLVKMTDEEFNNLVKAKKFGLEDLYTRDDYIYPTDENGKDQDFEYLDSIEFEGKEYLVLMPADELATEIVILEVEPVDEENENYLSVQDEVLLNKVYAIFKERYKDILTFED